MADLELPLSQPPRRSPRLRNESMGESGASPQLPRDTVVSSNSSRETDFCCFGCRTNNCQTLELDDVEQFTFMKLMEKGFRWHCQSCLDKGRLDKEDFQKVRTDLIEEIRKVIPDIIKGEMKNYVTKETVPTVVSNENQVKHSLLVQPKDGEQTYFTSNGCSNIKKKHFGKT